METNEKILYVDDEEPTRKAFARTLGGFGFTAVLASDPMDAVRQARQSSFAVVASDYDLSQPGMNGLDLVGKLRVLQPDATYVLVSGQCDMKLVLDAVNNHGVAFVVPKPWDPEELNSIMRRSIESYWERVGQKEVQRRMLATSSALQEQKQRLADALLTSGANMAEVLLSALNARDHETRGHCRRVAAITRGLAEALGVRGDLLTNLQYGALLHDIGKIGIPDSILLKPAKLTDDEWVVMRTHSEIGARMLEGHVSLEGAREMVLQHHERWDGTGYPQRLKGDNICLGARIFALADTLDAVMSDRPYRKGAPVEVAIDEIIHGEGTQFDPTAVKAFVGIPQDYWTSVRTRYPDEPPIAVAPVKVKGEK